MSEMFMFDVFEEILTRCHVKDLLRFKSVCKSWYSLITSPSFVKLQCKRIGNNKDQNRRIVLYTESAYDNRWSIGGSSNGLVCIYPSSGTADPIRVTNPLTRKFRELLKPPGLNWLDLVCLGFGYDSSTDDYKVVIVMNDYSDDGYGRKGALVHILNLKSSIWKPLGHFNYWFNISLATPGVLYNEALHWFWYDTNYSTYYKVLIVSFDLAKEEFRETPQPDDTRYKWNYGYTLGIIEGRLCILSGMIYNPRFCVWAIKNYNVKPSWELLPITEDQYETKNHAIHYMLEDDILYHPYYCEDNIQLARDMEYICSPIFKQTLVSPYVNNHGRPSDAKNSKRTVKSASGKEGREIQEVYTLKDGEKSEFHLEEDAETRRNERKQKSRSRN